MTVIANSVLHVNQINICEKALRIVYASNCEPSVYAPSVQVESGSYYANHCLQGNISP